MTQPCLEIVRPRGPAIALVCDSPHSGTQYPQDFGYHVDLADLRRCEDTLVEALWAAVPEVGGTLITIWHNHFLGSEPVFLPYRDVYQQFVENISLQPS